MKKKHKKKINFFPILFNMHLFSNTQNRILMADQVMRNKIKTYKNFFFFVFQIVHNIRFSYLDMKKYKKQNNLIRYERKVAPQMQLRIFALYSRLLRNGESGIAQKILSRVIVLLTENTREHSGCKVLNDVLRYLEPTVGLLIYRRGRKKYRMPLPVWPCRKYFIAAKFLVVGAKFRQKLLRISFMEALFLEILDVKARKSDCFTLKFFKKYRTNLLQVSDQKWRMKRRKI